MVLDASLLNTQHYKVRVKWRNPGKGVAPFPTLWCSSYWKGSLRVTLDYGHQLYLLLVFKYSYTYNLNAYCRGWQTCFKDQGGGFSSIKKTVFTALYQTKLSLIKILMHPYILKQIYINSHRCTQRKSSPKNIYTHSQIHRHSHTYTYAHSHWYTYIQYRSIQTCTEIHKNTHQHISKNMSINAYIYIYIYIYSLLTVVEDDQMLPFQ